MHFFLVADKFLESKTFLSDRSIDRCSI